MKYHTETKKMFSTCLLKLKQSYFNQRARKFPLIQNSLKVTLQFISQDKEKKLREEKKT